MNYACRLGLDRSLGLNSRTVKGDSKVCDTAPVRPGGFLCVRGPLDHGTFLVLLGEVVLLMYVRVSERGPRL
jgi:hypothetical protein